MNSESGDPAGAQLLRGEPDSGAKGSYDGREGVMDTGTYEIARIVQGCLDARIYQGPPTREGCDKDESGEIGLADDAFV